MRDARPVEPRHRVARAHPLGRHPVRDAQLRASTRRESRRSARACRARDPRRRAACRAACRGAPRSRRASAAPRRGRRDCAEHRARPERKRFGSVVQSPSGAAEASVRHRPPRAASAAASSPSAASTGPPASAMPGSLMARVLRRPRRVDVDVVVGERDDVAAARPRAPRRWRSTSPAFAPPGGAAEPGTECLRVGDHAGRASVDPLSTTMTSSPGEGLPREVLAGTRRAAPRGCTWR